ncbi:hypothetical protein VTN02DRAFT_170 [Thermoascus thermophilus]
MKLSTAAALALSALVATVVSAQGLSDLPACAVRLFLSCLAPVSGGCEVASLLTLLSHAAKLRNPVAPVELQHGRRQVHLQSEVVPPGHHLLCCRLVLEGGSRWYGRVLVLRTCSCDSTARPRGLVVAHPFPVGMVYSSPADLDLDVATLKAAQQICGAVGVHDLPQSVSCSATAPTGSTASGGTSTASGVKATAAGSSKTASSSTAAQSATATSSRATASATTGGAALVAQTQNSGFMAGVGVAAAYIAMRVL